MNELTLSAMPTHAAAVAPGMTHDVVRVPRDLDSAAKAAVIVRLLMSEGEDVPIDALPEDLQAKLTSQMGQMGLVDKVTLDAVVTEFTEALDAIGLTFPRGLARALEALDGKISPQTARRLRKEAGVREAGDPWQRLTALPVADLAQMSQAESVEVAAVLLSKLPTKKAAELLTSLPGPRARRMSYAVSLTSKVTPEAVDRIGLSLAAQLDQKPIEAFDSDPSERLGEILNQSTASTRDDMLSALQETDASFAEQVRRSIFLFEHIPARVATGDIPTILRAVDATDLITALAAASSDGDKATVDYILSNISSRMADGYREEMAERGKIRQEDGEAAMSAVVSAVRTLVQDGTIAFQDPVEDDDSAS
ncbi:MAG: flagellar motor switch protein FliG [Marinibacterium sp.]|nr:flagellar motor switch protein FliG [Marinibacterium sp.]